MMKFIKGRQTIFIFFLFGIFQFLVYRVWLFSNVLLTYGDWGISFNQTSKEFFTIAQIWTTSSLGSVNLTPSFYPFLIQQGLLANFNIPYQYIERLLFMWPIAIGLPFLSFVLLKGILKNPIAALVGSIVYSFNTYFLIIQTGHLTLMTAYTIAPLAVYLYIRVLNERKMILVIFSSLILFLTSYYEFRAFYVLCIALFFYYLFHLFVVEKISRLSFFIKASVYGALPIVITFLLNIYWILGLAKAGFLTSNVLFDRGLFGDEFANVLYAITIHHPFWTGGQPAIFEVQQIPFYFWLIPVFAFLGLMLNRKNKLLVFFGFIAILGILLTKQESRPFNGLYLWFFNHFPGFNAFRESSKFYFLIALGYSVLIAGFVDWISKNWIKGKRLIGRYLITLLIAVIFMVNVSPMITGQIKSLFVVRNEPKDYLVLNDFMLKQTIFFRTFWFPVVPRWNAYLNIHPALSASDIIFSGWKDLGMKKNITKNYTYAQAEIEFLKSKKVENLLDLSSVKYLIVPVEDNLNDDNFFINYGMSRQYYINELNKISYLHRIDIGTKEIVVYENKNYRQHIYITNNQESINKEQAYKTIDYKFINPTEYTFSVKNVANPFYLNFSESYHPQWDLRVGNFSWIDVLTKSIYFIDNKNHLKNDAGLNTFYINPTEVCKVESCKVNKDGSYDISGTLYFAPQSYMYLGLTISGVTLVAVLSYLFFVLGRNLYDRKNK